MWRGSSATTARTTCTGCPWTCRGRPAAQGSSTVSGSSPVRIDILILIIYSTFVWLSGGQLVKGEVYCQDEIMSTFNQRDKFYFPFQYNLSSNPIQWNVNIDNVQRERGKRLKSHPFHHFKSSILLYNPFVCICSYGLTRKYLIVLILVLRSCEPECIDTHVGVWLRDQDVQERLCARWQPLDTNTM